MNTYNALKELDVFYLATVESDQPRVRPFGALALIDDHIYISLNNQKEVYKQLKKNPKIEICGMSKDSSWIRVSATATEDTRKIAKDQMLDQNEGIKKMYSSTDGLFVVFKLTNVKGKKYSFTSAPVDLD